MLERCLLLGFCEAPGLIFPRPLADLNQLDMVLLKEQSGHPRRVSEINKVYENDITSRAASTI